MDLNYYKQYEPIFGAWKITRLIGEGSFGKVFEMEREDFGVTYKAALKAITVPANESEVREVMSEGMDEASVRTYFGSFVQDLVKEFALMSKLKGNSNVVSYENHQVIEHRDGIGWDILIQMELLTPLNKYTSTCTVTRKDVIKLGIDLCRALELCQKYNIIHRDVKPENIFISEVGDFKLGDFGIARTVEKTTSGLSKKGTYTYMAPEVYKGEAYGSTVDIYSLGIVLYRLLNGNRTPFLPAAPAVITHSDRENALVKRFSGVPLPPPLYADGRLAEIVLKACAYDPKERYFSPMQMRQELEAILYSQEEKPYIYPQGDYVPQDSLHYVRTGDPIPPLQPSVRPEAENSLPNDDHTIHIFANQSSSWNEEKQPTEPAQPAQNVSQEAPPAQPPQVFRPWEAQPQQPQQPQQIPPFQQPQQAKQPPQPQPVPFGGQTQQVPAGQPNPSAGQTAVKPKKSSAKLWIGIGAGIAAAILLAIGLYSMVSSMTHFSSPAMTSSKTEQNKEENENTDSAQSPGQGLSSEDYLQTLTDSQGRTVQKPIFRINSVSYAVYEYADQGDNLLRSTIYNLLGEPESITTYKYDGDGNRSASYSYDGNENLVSYNEYIIQNGQNVRTNTFDASGQMTEYTVYERNEKGSSTKSETYTADGVLEYSYTYEYDSQGRTMKMSYFENSALLFYIEYEYGEGNTPTVTKQYSSDGTLSYITEDDELGREIRFSSYYSGKEIPDYVTVNEYNEKGFCFRTNGYDGNDQLTYYSLFTYDERGKCVKETRYTSEDILSFEIEYNGKGDQTKTTYYTDDGALDWYITSEYDENGSRTKTISYRADGTKKEIAEYVEDYTCVKRSNYDENDQLESYMEYEYGDTGYMEKVSYYLADGTLDRYVSYAYDKKGNCTKESNYDKNGKLRDYVVREYNDKNKETKTSYYDADGTLTQYGEWQYDGKGNYIDTIWYNADGTKR